MNIVEYTSSININCFSAILRKGGSFISTLPWNSGRDLVRILFNYDALKMHFVYGFAGQNRLLTIELVKVDSNLGKGSLWYFVCPITQKRCRKLYFIAGDLVHRTAYKYTYYENQTMSRNRRERDKGISTILRLNKQDDDFRSRPPRIRYGENYTKRWIKYMAYVRNHCQHIDMSTENSTHL